MSTWRAAESPTHASTPECSQEYRDGPTAESGWGEALPTFHGPKLGPAAALEPRRTHGTWPLARQRAVARLEEADRGGGA
jgi:hypothetical protein